MFPVIPAKARTQCSVIPAKVRGNDVVREDPDDVRWDDDDVRDPDDARKDDDVRDHDDAREDGDGTVVAIHAAA